MTTMTVGSSRQPNNSIAVKELPHKLFTFAKDKWTSVRLKTIKQFTENWEDNPNQVLILQDSKLAEDPVVMLKKSNLDQLTKILDDLASGQAQVQHQLRSVTDAIAVVTDLANKEHIEGTLGRAISLLGNIQMQMETSIVLQNKPTQLQPKPVDDNLLSQLPDEDDDYDQ